MLTKADLSAETLAAVLEQSVDCVKLIALDGGVLWMNPNGLCLMEIDDFGEFANRQWSDLWPEEARADIRGGLASAATGNVARFQAPCPTAKGQLKFWDICISRVEDANSNHTGYLAVSRDITQITAARRAAEIASEELQHRIKNTYAMIGGLLAGYAAGNKEHEQFARDMHKRLMAISKAQTMFSAKQASCNIAELIPALVVPFDTMKCSVAVSNIPVLMVDQGRADAIALVLGELAVNASKHGALAAGGSIAVNADHRADEIAIIWVESSENPVTEKTRKGGQGLRLIKTIVDARGGTLDIVWKSYGLEVTLNFPLSE